MNTKFGIKTKLLFGFLAVSSLGALIGAISFFSNQSIIQKYNHIAQINMVQNSNLAVMSSSAKDVVRFIGKMGHDQMSATDFNVLYKDLDQSFLTFKNSNAEYLKVPFANNEKELHAALLDSWSKFVDQANEMIKLSKTGKAEETRKLFKIYFSDLEDSAHTFFTNLNKLEQLQKDEAIIWTNKAQQSATTSTIWTLSAVGFGILSSIFIGLFLSIALSKELNSTSDQLSTASKHVSEATEQLVQSGNNLSDSSQKTSTSLISIVTSVKEMSKSVALNLNSSQQASDLSKESNTNAKKGESEIQDLITSMTDISNSSKKIAEITYVIDDIAFQTNLLALNAAVEAARAGEQGKGFAVVADAVRTLAQKSSSAAKDIKNLIQKSVEQIENGGQIAYRSGTVLNQITSSAQKVLDLNIEITSANSQQSSNIQKISEMLERLNQVAKENSKDVTEIVGANKEMMKMVSVSERISSDLNNIVAGKQKSA